MQMLYTALISDYDYFLLTPNKNNDIITSDQEKKIEFGICVQSLLKGDFQNVLLV